jgi:hypothetical protein
VDGTKTIAAFGFLDNFIFYEYTRRKNTAKAAGLCPVLLL